MFVRILAALFIVASAPAQSRTPVVVELFTSEGCSSCPPADNLLTRLSQQQAFTDIEVIVLGEHVDYWNQLGWPDRFSSPAMTARQQEYGRVFVVDSIYTPQMVVNGQAEFLGSDEFRARHEIEKAAQGPRAKVSIWKVSPDILRFNVEHLPQGTHNADIVLAVTESNLESMVQRGENSGRRLSHTGVVRSLAYLGHLDSKKNGAYSADAKLNLHPDWKRENLTLVLFVQDRASRKILGAATLRLSPAAKLGQN
ncbi:MAG: DUF1223 domain-containing protein [Acidobacteria bacterium]|nr:MAG: DUF1223 domain-containing protein [Acidobacteriota bacterium]